MLLISSVSVFHIKTLLTPPFLLPIKVIFRFTLDLKLWLAYTTFSAIIPLHARTHSSTSYSVIFPHAFILIFLIILPTNTLRMKNQFIQLTRRFLHFIRTIRLTFLKYVLKLFLSFMQLQDFYHKDGGTRHTKGPPAENDRRPARRARGPRSRGTHPRRRVPPADPAFPGQSRRETAGATADG